MAYIKEIGIQNFKFFPKLEKPIELDGKHLLMYGENGAGKSTESWLIRHNDYNITIESLFNFDIKSKIKGFVDEMIRCFMDK